jgi:hypothetical protein
MHEVYEHTIRGSQEEGIRECLAHYKLEISRTIVKALENPTYPRNHNLEGVYCRNPNQLVFRVSPHLLLDGGKDAMAFLIPYLAWSYPS